MTAPVATSRARRKITLYFKAELLEEARSAVLALGSQGQEPSNLSRLFEAALEHELATLRSSHNGGDPFPLYTARLPGGRPQHPPAAAGSIGALRREATRERWRLIRLLVEREGKVCALCSRLLSTVHLDHIVPLSRGGTNDTSNLRLLCPRCNISKGARMDSEIGND